jgi:hypothetical protein
MLLGSVLADSLLELSMREQGNICAKMLHTRFMAAIL